MAKAKERVSMNKIGLNSTDTASLKAYLMGINLINSQKRRIDAEKASLERTYKSLKNRVESKLETSQKLVVEVDTRNITLDLANGSNTAYAQVVDGIVDHFKEQGVDITDLVEKLKAEHKSTYKKWTVKEEPK